MTSSGVAIMGAATASGEGRAIRAISDALDSPLLNNNDILGAKDILLNITSGTDEITMDEMVQITSHVIRKVGNNAAVIWGVGTDVNLGNAISVTIIATGFPADVLDLNGVRVPTASQGIPQIKDAVVKPGLLPETIQMLETTPAFDRRDLKVN